MKNPVDEQAQGRHALLQTGRVISGNELARLDGAEIALTGVAHGLPKYVTAENAGDGGFLIPAADTIGPWEVFVIRVMGNDTIALRAKASVNNNYVTAENAG